MSLPVELLTKILLDLPPKKLLLFKAVSKQWKALIDSQDFTNLHLNRSLAVGPNRYYVISTPVLYFCNDDTFANPKQLAFQNRRCEWGEIIGVCNGIVCLWRCYATLCLFNPTTQTSKDIPWPKMSIRYEMSKTKFFYGFGYDDVGKDYKCVRIIQYFDSESGVFESEVMIYSLREGKWRHWGVVPYYFSCRNNHFGEFLNGVVHWVGDDGVSELVHRVGDAMVEGVARKHLGIVCFDLREERFSSIELPEFGEEVFVRLCVGVMGGELSLVVDHMEQFDIWVMKEYGVVGSWTRICSVAKPPFTDMDCKRIIGFSRSKEEFFLRFSYTDTTKVDLASLELSTVEMPVSRKGCNAYECVENLMMLEDGNAPEKFVAEKQVSS